MCSATQLWFRPNKINELRLANSKALESHFSFCWYSVYMNIQYFIVQHPLTWSIKHYESVLLFLQKFSEVFTCKMDNTCLLFFPSWFRWRRCLRTEEKKKEHITTFFCKQGHTVYICSKRASIIYSYHIFYFRVHN